MRWVAARLGVLVGLGVGDGLGVLVGVSVMVAVGLGVSVGAGVGVGTSADILQASCTNARIKSADIKKSCFWVFIFLLWAY